MNKARILFKDGSLRRSNEYNAAIQRMFGSSSPPPPYFIPTHDPADRSPPALSHDIQDEYWCLQVPMDAPQRDLRYLFEILTRYYNEIDSASGIIDLLKSSGYMETYGYLSIYDDENHPDYETPGPHATTLINTLDVRLQVDNNKRLHLSAMPHHDTVMDYARAPIWGARLLRTPLANNQYGLPIITYPEPSLKHPDTDRHLKRLCDTMQVLGVTDSCDCIAMMLMPTSRLQRPYVINSSDEAERIYRFYQSYAKTKTGRYRTVELLKKHARDKSLRQNMAQAFEAATIFRIIPNTNRHQPPGSKP